jgi:carbon storage regulator
MRGQNSMLVLRRKINEALVIDHNIEIVVLGVEGDVVKLGIQAPKQKEIVRKELLESVSAENQLAMATKELKAELNNLLKTMKKAEK